MQATGIDDRGRKQYRYHPDFRARAEASKFAGLADFGKALPKIRRKVDKDLRDAHAEQAKGARRRRPACSTTIILRIGNREYAKENKSFGATTLLSRQVHDDGRKVRMRFKGKSGVEQEVTITDRTLRRVVRQLQELPGQALFQYVNGDGNPHHDHLERRQRLYPRSKRRRLHRQAFPHLGRDRPGFRTDAR